MKWEGAGTPLPDGHKIFQTYDCDDIPAEIVRTSEGWAIADESGRTPEDTDDGVLWLDTTRSLAISKLGDSEFEFIPLVDETGRKVHTPSNATTILYLSRMFHWSIEDDYGRFYNVR